MDDFYINPSELKNIFGPFDSYLKIIEDAFSTSVIVRDGTVKIIGNTDSLRRTQNVINELYELSKRGHSITEQQVRYSIDMQKEDMTNTLLDMDDSLICYTMNGRPVKPIISSLFRRPPPRSKLVTPISSQFILLT